MVEVSKIKEHLSVYASGAGRTEGDLGVPIGTVDHAEEGGQYIKLTKKDAPDNQHHWFPIDWVAEVDEKGVYLNRTPEEVMAGLIDEEPAE